jgi:hypothetical protein
MSTEELKAWLNDRLQQLQPPTPIGQRSLTTSPASNDDAPSASPSAAENDEVEEVHPAPIETTHMARWG